MTWRDRQTQASFAGIPFRFEFVTDENGQRINIFNPISAEPTSQPLGKTVRRIVVSGYFIGRDPHLDADRMRQAAASGKAAPLIHPYRGTLQARISQFALRDEKNAGGIVYFTAQFIEAKPAAGLTPLPAPREDANTSADDLRRQLQQLIGYTGGITPDDIAMPETAARRFTRELAGNQYITPTQLSNSERAREVLSNARNIYASAQTAARRILAVDSPRKIITELASGRASIDDIISFIKNNGGDNSAEPSGKIKRLTTTAAIAGAAKKISGGIDGLFADRQKAAAAQNDLLAAADIEAANADNDEVAIAVIKTAAAIAEVFDDELPSLPQLRQIETRQKNAAALLTEINGQLADGDIESLMRQNIIAHPLLLPDTVDVI